MVYFLWWIRKRAASSSFIWDPERELANVYKHSVDFITAAKVFKDPKRKIYTDSKHSKKEEKTLLYRKS